MHPSLPDPKNPSQDATDGTIFEELVQQYERLVTRTEDIIVQQVCTEVEAAWKNHFARCALPASPHDIGVLLLTCSLSTNSTRYSDISISPTLLPALSALSSHLSLLRRTLPHAPTSSIYRRIGSHLCTHILQRSILYRRVREITIAERRVLQRESELWVETCRIALPDAGERVEVPWRRLVQAGRILGANDELWEQILRLSFDDLDQEWGARITELIDGADLSREEVRMIARTRDDCAV